MAKEPERKNVWAQVGEYTSLAFVFPGAILAGYAVGYLLDRWLGTSFFEVAGLLLGIAAGFVTFIRRVQKDSSRDDG